MIRRLPFASILIPTAAVLACSTLTGSTGDLTATETAVAAQVMTQLAVQTPNPPPTSNVQPPTSNAPGGAPQFNPFENLTAEQEACLKAAWGEQVFQEITGFQRPPSPEEAQALIACGVGPGQPPAGTPVSTPTVGAPAGPLPPTPVSTKATAETWILQGYAVGKTTGNEQALGVMMADVIRLDDGRYRMYYGWMGQAGTGIKSAISSDGKTWAVESGFRLQGASDPNDREWDIRGPSIVRLPDGRYRMYYQSSPQPAQGEVPKFHVRSAVSSDGLSFTREGVRIDIFPYTTETGLRLAGHGTYFIANDGTYVGIFSGELSADPMGPSELVMATSMDGLTWSGFKKLYEDWHDPIVLKTAAGYVIYATYLVEKQGTAVSSDGLNWPSQMSAVTFQDQSGNTLTERDSGVGDLAGVVLADGSILIYANWGNPSVDIVYFTMP